MVFALLIVALVSFWSIIQHGCSYEWPVTHLSLEKGKYFQEDLVKLKILCYAGELIMARFLENVNSAEMKAPPYALVSLLPVMVLMPTQAKVSQPLWLVLAHLLRSQRRKVAIYH